MSRRRGLTASNRVSDVFMPLTDGFRLLAVVLGRLSIDFESLNGATYQL